MAVPTLSFTETQAFTALRSFLLSVVAPGIEVIRGEINRVAEPKGTDFIVMWPIRQRRLSTNETDFADNVLTGSIAGTTLTVSTISQAQSPLAAGMLIIDGNWPSAIAANTVIQSQLTGTPGGVGTYQVSISQTLTSQTLYAGVRSDLVPTEWVVQLDVHGPSSGDNVKIIEGLFRSEYGVVAIGEPSNWQVVPLYCEDARQIPFINDQQQYEFRWSMDACLQINPVIGTPAQFFDEIEIQTILADPRYVVDGQAIAPNPSPPSNPGGLVPWPPT